MIGDDVLDAWRAEQDAMRPRVRLVDAFEGPRTLGGFDVAYAGDEAFGALALLDAATLDVLEVRVVAQPVTAAYAPGFLAKREFPLLDALWRQVPRRPDVLFVDGHGTMHPRRMGSATYAGVLLDCATIGIGKEPYFGEPDSPPLAPGEAVPVRSIEGDILGYALWSSAEATRPIFVSPGHRVSVETALALARRTCRHRVPEPIRAADAAARRRAAIALPPG